jgi:hypothetical protein
LTALDSTGIGWALRGKPSKNREVLCSGVCRWIPVSELVQLLVGGQFAVDQQVADLDEGRFLGELLDRVAAVAQDPGVTVDVGNCALAGRGVDEALVEGGVAGLGQQRTQGDAVGTLSRMDDLQVKLAAGVIQGRELGVIGHRNPFVAGESALCPTKGSPNWRVHARVWTSKI